MRTLLLRLAGPTQAWDTRRVYADPTRVRAIKASAPDLAPTYSAIVGLLGCAMGRARGDLADLHDLTILVRADQPGIPRSEWRMSRRLADKGRAIASPRNETVLDDAVFLVAVGGDNRCIAEAAAALKAPKWALSLGMRAYPPTLPILLRVVDDDPERAITSHPWIAAPWVQRAHNGNPGDLTVTRVYSSPRSLRATPSVEMSPRQSCHT